MSPRRPVLLATLLLLLPLGGCAIHITPVGDRTRAPRPLSPEVAKRFEYERIGQAVLKPLEETDEAVISSATLLVKIPGDVGPTTVQFQWWQSRHPGRRPLVVVTPILGGGEALARACVEAFVEAGMHVAMVERGPRILAPHWGIEEVERYLRRGIASRRAVLDWAETRSDVDTDRMAAFGISMGGIVTSVLLAAEPRFACGVVALAGGDLPCLLRYSTEGRLVRWREARSELLGISEAEVEARLRHALPSDPCALAPAVDPRRVMFVTTRWDTIVPLANQELLWRAMGRPLRYDLPAGHYSGIVYLPFVLGRAVEWLEGQFEQQGQLAAAKKTR